MKDILAKRLSECRKAVGLTQTQVAAYCDITKKAYQNYELGIQKPKLDVFMRIARFYNVSMDYLAELTGTPAPYPRTSKD